MYQSMRDATIKVERHTLMRKSKCRPYDGVSLETLARDHLKRIALVQDYWTIEDLEEADITSKMVDPKEVDTLRVYDSGL